MNIWKAYCNRAYYNIYFDTLVAKGMSRENAERLKTQYCTYLTRIKDSRFCNELSAITNKQDFEVKLKEMFEVFWKGYLKYEEMPSHYYAYLKFLDSIQALHNDFINDDEKARLIDRNPQIPIPHLTSFETDYMIDGKLVAIMNPQLLFDLKKFIEGERFNTSRASIICQTFYGDLLPAMKVKDYNALLRYLWSNSHKVKKGGKHNQILIRFPDYTEEIFSTQNGLLAIVKFYGPKNVSSFKTLKIRNEAFIVKYVPIGKDAIYTPIDESYYINMLGNTKDRMNIARAINKLLGNKLDISLV